MPTSESPADVRVCIVHDPMTAPNASVAYATALAEAFEIPIFTGKHSAGIDTTTIKINEFHETSWSGRVIDALVSPEIRWQRVYREFTPPRAIDVVVTFGPLAVTSELRSTQRHVHVQQTTGTTQRPPDRGSVAARVLPGGRKGSTEAPTGLPASVDYVVGTAKQSLCELAADRDQPTTVIYPPVTSEQADDITTDGYLYADGDLTPTSRIESVVRAATAAELDLVVTGTGPLRERLQELAGPTVTIRRNVSHHTKKSLRRRCTGVIAIGRAEAPGIPIQEAFAVGKPVFGWHETIAEEYVTSSDLGMLYEPATDDLEQALTRFQNRSWDTAAIVDHADKYRLSSFVDAWAKVLTSVAEQNDD